MPEKLSYRVRRNGWGEPFVKDIEALESEVQRLTEDNEARHRYRDKADEAKIKAQTENTRFLTEKNAAESERDAPKKKLDASNATWFRLSIARCETIKRAETIAAWLAEAQELMQEQIETVWIKSPIAYLGQECVIDRDWFNRWVVKMREALDGVSSELPPKSEAPSSKGEDDQK